MLLGSRLAADIIASYQNTNQSNPAISPTPYQCLLALYTRLKPPRLCPESTIAATRIASSLHPILPTREVTSTTTRLFTQTRSCHQVSPGRYRTATRTLSIPLRPRLLWLDANPPLPSLHRPIHRSVALPDLVRSIDVDEAV
jgi:hypothetical protein